MYHQRNHCRSDRRPLLVDIHRRLVEAVGLVVFGTRTVSCLAKAFVYAVLV